MTKGIIVVDMPESCSECPCFSGFYSDMSCKAMNNRTIDYPYPDSFRQSWCPIKPYYIENIIEKIHEYFLQQVEIRTEGMEEIPSGLINDLLQHNKEVCKIVKGGTA